MTSDNQLNAPGEISLKTEKKRRRKDGKSIPFDGEFTPRQQRSMIRSNHTSVGEARRADGGLGCKKKSPGL